MTRHLNLGAFALFSLATLALMIASLSQGASTGLFAEDHGDCTIIYGGTTAYRYCGPEVNPVSEIAYFPSRNTHSPFIASDQQQYGSFDGPQQQPSIHELRRAPITYQRPSSQGESLDSQQFPINTRNARRNLLDDPYAATPWQRHN